MKSKGIRLKKRTSLFTVFCFLLFSVFSTAAWAAEDTDEVMSQLSLGELLNLDKELVTATKRKTSVRKAPAIATVFTADEIKNMGARNLMDVLKMVPGFGVSISVEGRYMFEVRGTRTLFSEKIMVMMDGHRLNYPYIGSALDVLFYELSMKNVKQIEVVRGPGSALYGANAFVAVVNVITKNADDVDGIETAVAGGSFDTKKVSVLGGKSFEDFKIVGSFNHTNTDGFKGTVEKDSLSETPFSTAPGETDMSLEYNEAFLKMSYGDLTLKGQFAKRNGGAYIGFTSALTDDNDYDHENFWTELTYAKSFSEKFSASLRTYFDYYEITTNLELVPEGFPGYPDGMFARPDLKNKTIGAELQFDTDLFKNNHLIFGLNFESVDQYDVRYIVNYNPWTNEPLGSMQDVSSWGNYNRDTTREIWAAYLQDEWEIMENLNITAGVRYDHYDDFGSTVNPRAGVVWNFLKDVDLKLLYGQAFRAPNFVDLYNDGNPVYVGNPELDPETIKTYEASLGYRFGNSHAITMNYFYNKIDDQIVLDTSTSPGRYVNRGGSQVDGVEIMLNGKYSPANYWQLTYTWQNPRDAVTDEDLPYVPSHRASLAVNYEICKYLIAHTDILWTGERPRPAGDTRDDVSSYTTVDLTLIAKNFYKNFEIRGIVHNLFDEDYSDPDMTGAAQSVPNDYPREGISALIELSYKF